MSCELIYLEVLIWKEKSHEPVSTHLLIECEDGTPPPGLIGNSVLGSTDCFLGINSPHPHRCGFPRWGSSLVGTRTGSSRKCWCSFLPGRDLVTPGTHQCLHKGRQLTYNQDHRERQDFLLELSNPWLPCVHVNAHLAGLFWPRRVLLCWCFAAIWEQF